MGWEADLAIRARIGAKDIVWIDLETGMMQPVRRLRRPASTTRCSGPHSYALR